MARVTVSIDGHEVQAVEGEPILTAARRAGIDIPTLCQLDGVSVWGACRLCLVEVAEEHPLRPACATAVAEDMEVTTVSDRLSEHRRTILELLLAEGNHICAVCVANGHCELQDLAAEHGVDHVSLTYQFPDREVDATHDRFVFDPNRCVLCTRCVRTCDEVEGAHVWDVASRGFRQHLVVGMDQAWGDSALCTSCGKCVAVCPTGALVAKGRAVGERRADPEVTAFLTTARQEQAWLTREQDR